MGMGNCCKSTELEEPLIDPRWLGKPLPKHMLVKVRARRKHKPRRHESIAAQVAITDITRGRGMVFHKYPEEEDYFVFLSFQENATLHFGPTELIDAVEDSPDIMTSVPISIITDVIAGKVTTAWDHGEIDVDPLLCWSVIYQSKSADFVAGCMEERNVWVNGLRLLKRNPHMSTDEMNNCLKDRPLRVKDIEDDSKYTQLTPLESASYTKKAEIAEQHSEALAILEAQNQIHCDSDESSDEEEKDRKAELERYFDELRLEQLKQTSMLELKRRERLKNTQHFRAISKSYHPAKVNFLSERKDEDNLWDSLGRNRVRSHSDSDLDDIASHHKQFSKQKQIHLTAPLSKDLSNGDLQESCSQSELTKLLRETQPTVPGSPRVELMKYSVDNPLE